MHFDGDKTQRARFWSNIAVHFSIVHYFSGFLSTNKFAIWIKIKIFWVNLFLYYINEIS